MQNARRRGGLIHRQGQSETEGVGEGEDAGEGVDEGGSDGVGVASERTLSSQSCSTAEEPSLINFSCRRAKVGAGVSERGRDGLGGGLGEG